MPSKTSNLLLTVGVDQFVLIIPFVSLLIWQLTEPPNLLRRMGGCMHIADVWVGKVYVCLQTHRLLLSIWVLGPMHTASLFIPTPSGMMQAS